MIWTYALPGLRILELQFEDKDYYQRHKRYHSIPFSLCAIQSSSFQFAEHTMGLLLACYESNECFSRHYSTRIPILEPSISNLWNVDINDVHHLAVGVEYDDLTVQIEQGIDSIINFVETCSRSCISELLKFQTFLVEL